MTGSSAGGMLRTFHFQVEPVPMMSLFFGEIKKKPVLLISMVGILVLSGMTAKLNADTGTKKLKRAIKNFQKGSKLYENKRFDAAIEKYRMALGDDSIEPYWHAALGRALEARGVLQGALEEFKVAKDQSPLDSGLGSEYREIEKKLKGNPEATGVGNVPDQDPPYIAKADEPWGNISPPRPTYKPDPSYSDKARNAKHQGKIRLLLVVDSSGNVRDTKIVKPLGVGLDEKALETVRTWKFKPAMRGDVPVPVRVYVEIAFKLF